MVTSTLPEDIQKEKDTSKLLVIMKSEISALEREHEEHRDLVKKAEMMSTIAARLEQVIVSILYVEELYLIDCFNITIDTAGC